MERVLNAPFDHMPALPAGLLSVCRSVDKLGWIAVPFLHFLVSPFLHLA